MDNMEDSMTSDDIEELQHSAQDSELSSQVSSVLMPKISQRPIQSNIHLQCDQINKTVLYIGNADIVRRSTSRVLEQKIWEIT